MMSDNAPTTLFEKIWDRPVVLDRPDGQSVLHVERDAPSGRF